MKTQTHDKSWHTEDRGPPESGGRFLTVEKLGPRRELMKNGMLVCYDVPVARVGFMLYGPGEVPVPPAPGQPGLYVERTADELFDPETIASFEGIGLVNDHPDFSKHPEGLTADNAAQLAGGYLTNVRAGKDGDEDVLVGDLVVTRRDFIDAIMGGKREISAGYDAIYKTVRPGFGRQHNIIANHIALVGKGRCGPRCAIGDHATTLEQEQLMAPQKDGGARRRVKLDDVEYEEIAPATPARRRLTGDDEEAGIHVHVHTAAPTATADAAAGGGDDEDVDKRVGKLEKMIADVTGTVTALGESLRSLISGRAAKTADELSAEAAAQATADAAAKATADAAAAAAAATATQDSAALAASYQDLVSKSEILVPGFKVPTFDAAAKRQLTVDSMCTMRRSVLDQFIATEPGKASVAAIVGDVASLKEMDCASVSVVFNAAAAAKATANTAAATRDSHHVPAAVVPLGSVSTISVPQLSAAHRKFWDKSRKA